MNGPMLEDAIALAVSAHRGQRDLAGLPFILHPLRVMLSFTAEEDFEARIVGVLHDIVEDTKVSLAELLDQGYSELALTTVDHISRRKGERYTDYIKRLAENPLAVRVKLADLRDNTDPSRPSTAMLAPSLRRRYEDAQRYLLDVEAATKGGLVK